MQNVYLDSENYFTHKGHTGSVPSLAACPASQNFSNGGRALGDGWAFSGGQDATVKVWERGRVDPKATLDGHTGAIRALFVLPGISTSVFGDDCSYRCCLGCRVICSERRMSDDGGDVEEISVAVEMVEPFLMAARMRRLESEEIGRDGSSVVLVVEVLSMVFTMVFLLDRLQEERVQTSEDA
ncbi:MAG: hypothetical protein M1834_000622 [Cirrosporium novae-zelandiae]|nr:MAG: hypothetical protein M1834_000622 [Cirrosporium novae-zelandiae]